MLRAHDNCAHPHCRGWERNRAGGYPELQSREPHGPARLLLLQSQFYYYSRDFFFFLSWSVHNGMRSEKVGIPALRNSRKNTVQRQKVLPGSEISEFQMSSLLSFAAFEGAFPSCLRCHKRWILSPCSADFSKWQKMPLKYSNWQHWLHK